MTTLRMIAGLGNPDEKYLRTLHNAGFWFVDELARRHGGLGDRARTVLNSIRRAYRFFAKTLGPAPDY